MDLEIVCPNCGKRLAVPETYRGKKGVCNGCGGPVYVPASTLSPEKLPVFQAITNPPPMEQTEPRMRDHGRGVQRKHIPWIFAAILVLMYYLPSTPTPPAPADYAGLESDAAATDIRPLMRNQEVTQAAPAPVYVAPAPEPKPRPTLTEEHIRAAQLAIVEYGFPVPSLRQNSINIRAEVQLTEQPPHDIEEFAKAAVLAMRNAVYMMPGSDHDWWIYKLTIYGPPPGPGFVQVIGVAIITPNGDISWKFGKPS